MTNIPSDRWLFDAALADEAEPRAGEALDDGRRRWAEIIASAQGDYAKARALIKARYGVGCGEERLPFVVNSEPPGSGQCCWQVQGTGDYGVDVAIGDLFAGLYIGYLDRKQADGMPATPFLQWIVADMPRQLSGVEIGFLSRLGKVALDRTSNRPVFGAGYLSPQKEAPGGNDRGSPLI